MTELSLLQLLPNQRHLLTSLEPQNHVLGISVPFWDTSPLGPSKGFWTELSLRGAEGSRKRKRRRGQFFTEGWARCVPGSRGSVVPSFPQKVSFSPVAGVQVNHLDAAKLVWSQLSLIPGCGPFQGLSCKPYWSRSRSEWQLRQPLGEVPLGRGGESQQGDLEAQGYRVVRDTSVCL